MKEADRGKDAGPRAGVEATQSGNNLRKKGFEIVKATLKKAWLEGLMQLVSAKAGSPLGAWDTRRRWLPTFASHWSP